jgi:cardiolipin synthase
MISEADKSIYIQTPYFVPDDSLFESLRIAALSGIDVRIMIPAMPDHPFVYWAALSYLGDLISVGVKCYRYQKGFVHSKILMIDSLVCSVGTANVDIRSLKLNFEINAFIYDSDVTRELESQFTNDIEDCHLMDSEWYNARGQWTKIREALSRLLSPLL